MPLTSNERLGCYAMLRSLWNTGSDYLAPFERMVVSVLRKHKGSNITIDVASKELFEIWKIDIPRMPMMHLFSRLSAKGIVTKRHNDKHFVIHKECIRDNDAINENDVNQMADRYEEIVNECRSFCLSQKPSIPSTNNQIRNELAGFLSQQATNLAISTNNRGPAANEAGQSFYRVGLYINHLSASDPGKLRFLNDIAVGHVLCKCLALDGERIQSLSDLTIFLDADIVFILLGIDFLERTDDYKRLVNELRDLGATLKVFQHNIDEINIALDNAIEWVNSPNYDPILASKATRFFVEKNMSVSEIELIQSTFTRTLELDYGITIEPANYDANYNNFNHNEGEIQKVIRNKYDEILSDHVSDADSRSIQRDAISVNQIYRRRCGINNPNLAECKYVLITTNVSFAKAIKDYEKTIGLSENCIAACITDALVGTLVWLSQPTRIEEESYARLNALARASFIPSEAEIAEFSKQIGEAYKRGEISESECYFLRTAQVSREMLKKVSIGTPTKINETTPEEILKLVFAKGEEKVRKEITAEYDEKLTAQKKISDIELQKQIDARIKGLRELKQEKETRLFELKVKKKKCEKVLLRERILFAVIIVALLVFACNKLSKKEWFWGGVSILPVVAAVVFVIINIITQKQFNLEFIIQKALLLFLKKKTEELAMLDTMIGNINESIENINIQIEQLEQAK